MAVESAPLTAGLKRQVDALKRPVMDAAGKFAAVREKLSDLAPKVMKVFTAITAENERFTFVEFVRLFDSSVPTKAGGEDGYRVHRTYYTLAYMRRMVQLGGAQRQGAGQGVRNNATDALARTLATVLQIVADQEAVYRGIQEEFGWGERIMTRLKKRVEDTKPLFKLASPKPLRIGNVIHMAEAKAAAQQNAGTGGGNGRGALAQPGRTVTLPAPSEGGTAKGTSKRKRAA